MSKRKAITLETKYEVISKRYKGAKACDLMQEYDLASSTVATIMKNKEKILAEYESNAAGSKRNQASSRIKQPTYQDIDNVKICQYSEPPRIQGLERLASAFQRKEPNFI